MKPERWKQIERLYDAALERDADRRTAFLDQACEGDEELRREVASLLASDEQAGSFLAAPATEVMARSVAAEGASSLIGRLIGAYQVQSLLGAGGMGEVYLARDTRLGRKVAIKFLPAFFAQDVDRLRRFEREARATSALNHPNILTVYQFSNIQGGHMTSEESNIQSYRDLKVWQKGHGFGRGVLQADGEASTERELWSDKRHSARGHSRGFIHRRLEKAK
jgi:eukaryotic-like serine/threonine-protein kinase